VLDGEVLQPLARKRSVDHRRRIQIVFQNPSEALNPRHSVAEEVSRPARLLRGMSSREAAAEVDRLLEAVRLPARTARRYPRELSGGERQRVAIARALAARPDLLICDEITSALDVSVQAVVLELLRDLRSEFGLSVIFISHDLGVVATVAEQVLVLEQGVICERGATAEVLGSPRHPYTQRLLEAAPSLSAAISASNAVAAG
jgi:peptide/nickel transport system ATP-binding protein